MKRILFCLNRETPMIDLKTLQIEIIENRKRRNWASAYDLHKTTEGLAEEVGEWARAIRVGDRTAAVDAVGDVMVWCLGALEILNQDADHVLLTIVENNKTRTHMGHY